MTWCKPFAHNLLWLFCFCAPSWTRLLWQKYGHGMGVCCLRFGFRACFLALLTVADLIVVALAIPARTPLLTGADIGATTDRADTLDDVRQEVAELGLAKMLAVVLSRILADSETGGHSIGRACYRRAGHCDRCALVLRCSWKLHPSP